MLRILSCLSVILFLSVASNAADDGGLFSFLNLESDARSLGLSGATVAMPMGGYGVVSNPAALAFCDTAEIIIGSRSMLLDMWVAPLGVVVPLHRDSVSIGTVAGSFVYQSHGTERAVDNRNEDLGYSWNVYAASGAVSYAAKVWRGCAVGLQLKTDYHYIYASPVDLISATAVALDVAAQYRVMHDRLIYGFTIKNLQIYLMPYSDLYAGHRMPLAFEAGVSFVPATLSQLRATLSVNKVEFEHAMYRIGDASRRRIYSPLYQK